MRLNRLDLTRYGKFTDRVIDFGSPAEVGCDLHIVYGPNEAGKSTLFNAWLDLLYGIGAQSSYNFLHPYPTMQIGASIAVNGETREFIRRKRAQGSLFDARDQPVSEGALLAGLGGLDRDAYRTMFSLDDETLEQGGESILASRGDLGELLFSASAGLGELSQRLLRLRGEAEDFYKYRARSGRLAELKTELADLKAERDRLDTQASDHARLTRAHDEAAARHQAASAERQKIRARLDAINRLLLALPQLGELDMLARQIEPLAGLPDAAPEWRDRIRRLSDEEAALEAGGAALEAEIARLETELGSIDADPVILAISDRMTDLDRLRTRHNAADEDLSDRRTALARIEGRIDELLARLGRPGETEPDRLLLDAATGGGLRDLIESRASLDLRLATAKREAADARAAREELEAQFGEAAAPEDDVSRQERASRIAALTSLIAAILGEDHGLRRQAALRAVPEAKEKCEMRLRALRPWQGGIGELEAMLPPTSERLRQWKSQSEDLQRKLDAAQEETARLGAALRRQQAEAAAIVEIRGLTSAEAVAALRAARDQAWADHKSRLEPRSAEAFEDAMQAFDAAIDRRASHQADVARLNECTVQIAVLEADLERAALARSGLAAARLDLKRQMNEAVAAMAPGLPADMTPDDIEAWLARRDLALDSGRALAAHLRELDRAEADRKAATERLVRALAPLDATASTEEELETLIARAQDLLARESRLEARRFQLAEQARALKRRDQELRNAEDDLTAWMLAWKTACAACWLGEGERAPTAAEVREILPLLGELGMALHERAGLADRIAKMEQDQADYAAALHKIADRADIDTKDASVTAIAERLDARLAAAARAQSRRADSVARLDDTGIRQRAHAAKLDAHRQIRDRMLAALGAASLTEAALAVDQALERKALSVRMADTRQRISENLGLASFEDARERLEEVEAAALAAEKLEFEALLETLDAEVQELYAARSRLAAELAAIGGDDAVALIEQRRQTVLIAIAEGAEHYLRLSAGILAMEQALMLYRERHRSSMMARASDAIRLISRSRYTGLASQPDRGRETLIAIQNDGASKQAADMSKGARFQLYLALRVAGFHEFAETRPPVPFIADDIMETFDDFRAEETFRLFAGMAGAGQVIYLTHHRHLCNIARTVCPDVTIHELNP